MQHGVAPCDTAKLTLRLDVAYGRKVLVRPDATDMRHTQLIGALLTALIQWGAIAEAAAETYTVQPGDILGAIAIQHGVTVADMREWNAIDGDVIRVGQELQIRSGGRSSGYLSYTVASGDTVGGIAEAHGVAIVDVVGWNSDLDPDRINVGQTLRIRRQGRGVRRVEYEVQSGDFLGRIAERHRVSVADLVSWNSGLDPDQIRIGQVLVMMIEGPEVASTSVGRAYDGRLVNGELLPPHRAYSIRDEVRAWGTNETVSAILDVFDHMTSRFDDLPRLEIHDLSREEGGSISDHRSHQSGRDADIGYYHAGCRRECSYRSVDPSDFDRERNWEVLSYWIDNGLVDYAFVDYSYQQVLYDWLRERGVSGTDLGRWFQYPHGRDAARGIIRHEPNHRDHMHVRFACDRSDPECR